MKHKILLVGRAEDVIDRFFLDDSDTMECMTSSLISADLANQLRIFRPDVVVYCMKEEPEKQVLSASANTGPASKTQTPLAIIGKPSDYNFYLSLAPKNAAFFLERARPFGIIRDLLLSFIKDNDHKNNESFRKEAATESDRQVTKEKKSILVIDDSPIMLRTIADILKSEYEVASAPSGKAARHFLQRKSVDMIFLDYEMPEENGLVVFEKLKSDPRTADIPIVFLTGVKDSNNIRKALSLKPDGYLLKPIDAAALKEKIKEVLHI